MTKTPTTFQKKKYELKKQIDELSSIEDVIHKTLIESSNKVSFFNDNQTIMKEMNEDCFLTKQFIQHNVDKSNMKSYFYLLFLQYLYNFVKDDSKISFKHSSEQSFTDDDIQDTIILKEQIKKIKDTKDKLKFDVRKNAIEFVKQKGNIDDMIKELDSIEECNYFDVGGL